MRIVLYSVYIAVAESMFVMMLVLLESIIRIIIMESCARLRIPCECARATHFVGTPQAINQRHKACETNVEMHIHSRLTHMSVMDPQRYMNYHWRRRRRRRVPHNVKWTTVFVMPEGRLASRHASRGHMQRIVRYIYIYILRELSLNLTNPRDHWHSHTALISMLK